MTLREAEFQEEPRQGSQEPDAADRRNRRRYSLRLAIRCRRIKPRFPLERIIVGESLNISSKGMLFEACEAFLPGQLVEVFIDWPLRLHNCVRLTLAAEGTVVRIAGTRVAMLIEKHEFRTCGAGGAAVR